MAHAGGKFAESLLEALDRDEDADAVISRRLHQVEPSDEWTQPQLVVEVDTTLNTEQAFRMMERLDEAYDALERQFGLPLHSAVVMVHWRPNAH